MFSKIYLTFLLLHFFYSLEAQEFKIVRIDSVFNDKLIKRDSLSKKAQFGGISGIEFFENQLWMVSDRAYKNDTSQQSFVFVADTLGSLLESRSFIGLKNAESIRFNSKLKKWFYAFEREDSTGIGFVDELGLPQTIFNISMKFDNPRLVPNRGIESLTFDGENNLWYSLESTEKPFLFFYKVSYDSISNSYDFANAFPYPYSFEANTCLDSLQKVGANLGNGVSEILYEKEDQYLVLERCFNGRSNVIKIFRFCPYQTGTLTKKLVFEFSLNNEFLGKDAQLKPDNMEGMCWVNTQNGQRELYLISDDNFNYPRQRTLLLRLKE